MFRPKIGWALGLALALTTSAARADIEPFSTPAGSQDTDGESVSATASFNVTTNSIVVTLTNLQSSMHSAGQLISDLFFKVGDGSQTPSTLSSSSGQEVTVAGNGTATLGSTVSTGWGYTVTSGVGHLDDLNGGASPHHTIIGPPNASGVYDNANSSITNGAHSPFLSESATFTFSGLNLSNTTNVISNVVFSFGTTSGDNINGVVVPEPSTLAIAGLGALGFMGFGFRRRLKKSQ
jgi:hypothetical protein